MSVAGAALQRDAPAPTRIAGGGKGVGGEVGPARGGRGYGAIARKMGSPVRVPGLKRPLDEEPAKARTVEIKIRAQHLPVRQEEAADEAPIVEAHFIHRPLNTPDAETAGIGGQILRHQPCVEMQGVFLDV